MMIFMIIIQFANGVNTVSIDFIKFLNMVGEWEGAALDDVFERASEYSSHLAIRHVDSSSTITNL
jgi:hypothetical protein